MYDACLPAAADGLPSPTGPLGAAALSASLPLPQHLLGPAPPSVLALNASIAAAGQHEVRTVSVNDLWQSLVETCNDVMAWLQRCISDLLIGKVAA